MLPPGIDREGLSDGIIASSFDIQKDPIDSSKLINTQPGRAHRSNGFIVCQNKGVINKGPDA